MVLSASEAVLAQSRACITMGGRGEGWHGGMDPQLHAWMEKCMDGWTVCSPEPGKNRMMNGITLSS